MIFVNNVQAPDYMEKIKKDPMLPEERCAPWIMGVLYGSWTAGRFTRRRLSVSGSKSITIGSNCNMSQPIAALARRNPRT
jgi:hypothetical protein